MKTLLRRATPSLLLLLAAACAGDGASAPLEPDARFAAGGNGNGASSNTTTPVTFTLSAGTCGLTTDVTATGEMHTITHSTALDNGGTFDVAFNVSAHGTAVGADGSQYTFNYHGNRRRVTDTGIRPFNVHITDHFHLIGKGGAPDIHTFFNIYYTLEVNGTRTYLREVRLGDADHCDPI